MNIILLILGIYGAGWIVTGFLVVLISIVGDPATAKQAFEILRSVLTLGLY